MIADFERESVDSLFLYALNCLKTAKNKNIIESGGLEI